MGSNFRSIIKSLAEIRYWKLKKIMEVELTNTHYKTFYTTNFNLSDDFYQNKTVLDIGCGPRGSLEWADMVKERIGIDPLVNKYQSLGINKHKMTYVHGYSENMPFPNNYFDVICSFNSLDHVDDLVASTKEIIRTLKKGGLFLLMVDVHPYPTITEPQTINWDFVEKYFFDFNILDERRLNQLKKRSIYSNVRQNSKVNGVETNFGVLVVKLQKKV